MNVACLFYSDVNHTVGVAKVVQSSYMSVPRFAGDSGGACSFLSDVNHTESVATVW